VKGASSYAHGRASSYAWITWWALVRMRALSWDIVCFGQNERGASSYAWITLFDVAPLWTTR